MTRTDTGRARRLLVLGAVVTLALAALLAWASFRPAALESVKTLTVYVTHTDGEVTAREIRTTARTLGEALAPSAMLEFYESDLGSYLWAVDGEYLNADTGLRWYCAVNSTESVPDTKTRHLADGDVYSFYAAAYES